MSSGIELIDRAERFKGRVALVDAGGEHRYEDLLGASAALASTLLDQRADLGEDRVAFLVGPGFDYAAAQWGIWRAGGVAVPLAVSHPVPELEYVLDDSEPCALIASSEFADRLAPLARARGLRLIVPDGSEAVKKKGLPCLGPDRRAMILYTSGTTSRPKGAVTTHGRILAQIRSLVSAWEWSPDDRILHTLPLHHLHGLLNILLCALWSGAVCEMARFEPTAVWDRFISGGLTLFMAVPTIYARLIRAYEGFSAEKQARAGEAARAMRLMVSGSAALPPSVLEQWREMTGHVLLERYGMTEIGMGLSNPLHGERVPGSVGLPLPGVEVRVVSRDGVEVEPPEPGEIQVRGPGVFLEYWRKPEATAASFTSDGWFRTGDVAAVASGRYRILGRESVDIIKTGGYKVSALEIEALLLTHPDVDQCAVVGLDDLEWGQRVAAAVVLKPGRALALEPLRAWCKQSLAPYKVPSRLLVLNELPRNAMGKVTKPPLASLFS